MHDISDIAVIGAGDIGRRHCDAVKVAPGVTLSAVVDPSPSARDLAGEVGVAWFGSLDEMIMAKAADGVILATPNALHAKGAEQCIDAALPVLVEKPIFTDLAHGKAILDKAGARGVAIAAGHHRRHNPLIARAKDVIREGALGRIVSVQGTTWFRKPDDYFDADWRRKKGAGPVYLNLIHDIDLLLHLCGAVAEVRAIESRAVRGNEVEDTAVVLLTFANGALGTVNVSDCIVAPWSWELTARENPAYPATPETCYWIGGTEGSLALPNLSLWKNPQRQSWWEPIASTKLTFGFDDPLVKQAEQFGRVVRGQEAPLVSGYDGLAALAVIEAIKTAATTGTALAPEAI